MHFALKDLALLSLFALAVSGASKFANTCENIESSGTMIQAECQEYENGQSRLSSLDLNHCIRNQNGSLKCGKKLVLDLFYG
ncbi:uncharacterized protein N7482_007367 [Penicillium canariense]|uniref:Cyanovirin-N domain-containing protein n=1 Tax=Penicillium canariense TaxID=189055 RepID=A0A9W9HYY1_9EURO|nr:uncharacterized protein N7482_007367 [Penicillium canariense]KAJ5160363.1 hypothetical protein N7482_007367 [Penicillium canariense]